MHNVKHKLVLKNDTATKGSFFLREENNVVKFNRKNITASNIN